MNKQTLLLAMMLLVSSQAVMGDASAIRSGSVQGRIQDGIEAQQWVAGIFQRYDASRKIVRISDVDYDIDPSTKLGSALGEFRSGQTVLFTQGGTSAAKRNVLTSIKPQ